MEFFKLEPAETDDGTLQAPLSGESPPESRTQPRQPLFKQDPLPGVELGNHVSLSAYISRHLEGGRQAAPEGSPTLPGPLPPPAGSETREYKPEGQFLNTLDVDMTAGLEQYMPTPLFRLRVMKKRLDGEIADLRQRVNKMERLNDQPRELRENIEVIRRRIATLEAHQRQVSRQLEALLAMGPLFFEISQVYERWQAWLGRGFDRAQAGVANLLFGPARQELVQLGEELGALTEVLDERFRDATVTQSEISHLINRYDATLRQMEAASLRMRSEGFWQRLWQPLRGLVK